MSHRQELKTKAREQRLAAEREAQARAARKRRLRNLGIVGGVALIAVIVLVVVSMGGGNEDDGAAEGGTVAGTSDSQAMLQGVPQDGSMLGDPDAPMVMTEFADLQCPFCKQYAEQVLPVLIQDYVRTGELRLELRLLRFIGDDSDRGARAAVAAGDSDRMWNFTDLFFRNQGAENTGYADDEFIGNIAEAAGVPRQEALDAIGSAEAEKPITQAEQEAADAGISSTPSFLIGEEAGKGKLIEVESLTPEAYKQAIDAELE
jgi:protein-disulfide isomerase